MATNAVNGSGSSYRIRDTVTRLMFFSLVFIYVAQYQFGGKDAYGSIPTVAREENKSGEGKNGWKADAKLTGVELVLETA